MSQSHLRLRARTLAYLKEKGPQSRAELARIFSVSRSTMNALIVGLETEDLVQLTQDDAQASKSAGRPGVRVALKETSGFFVGIDFGRLRINVAISDSNYRILGEISEDFDIDIAAGDALDRAAAAVEQLISQLGIRRGQINAVGVGVPGPVDAATGMLHAGSILASWVGADVPGGLSKRLGLPVYMDNDANLGALAEGTYGAAVGAKVALYVLLSVGVGLGIIINGRVFRGASGIAGELGHVVTDEHGLVCRCGGRGCLEARVSVVALAKSLSATHGQTSYSEMLELAKTGAAGAERIVADAGILVGRRVGDLCNYFNPDLILVGGELMRAGDALLVPLRDAMRRFSIARASERVKIMPGGLGEKAELIGTLLFAAERYFESVAAGTPGQPGARPDDIQQGTTP